MSLLFRLTRGVISNPVVARNILQRVRPKVCIAMASRQIQPRVSMSQQSSEEQSDGAKASNVTSDPVKELRMDGSNLTDPINQEKQEKADHHTLTRVAQANTAMFVLNEKPNGSSQGFSETALTTATQEAGDLVKTASPMKWEALATKVQTGAILPFSDLSTVQLIFLPYTYTAMYYLDFLHQHMPWWQAIILTTVTARLIFFPFVLKQNIIGIKTSNILPETQRIQVQMNEAMANGDSYNKSLAYAKLMLLYKEHGVSMKDRFLPLLISAPMSVTMFFLLRKLTGIPAEGLSTGGAFWFTDLTLPDPLYILPIMTATSLFLVLEFGLEGSLNPKQGMTPQVRYVIRTAPFFVFLFIQSFDAATLLFWSTSNLFTLGFALLFRNQWFKTKFKIPKRLVHDPASLPMANMTFKDQLREAIEKGRVKRTSMDVRRLDDIAFRKAGVGPLRKTYKEPPKGGN